MIIKRSIIIPVELDAAIASIYTENGISYDDYIVTILLGIRYICDRVEYLESIPKHPNISKDEIK